jgi:hypothetical protein
MAYSVTPLVGIDLVNTVTAVQITAGYPINQLLGVQVWGSDGLLYVFGKANASITATTTACTVNASTFLVTASGGSYTSPATAMVTGDYGWFSKASV